MQDIDSFREDAHGWLIENFPATLKGATMGLEGEADEAVQALTDVASTLGDFIA